MNIFLLDIRRTICTFVSALIPVRNLRHKVRYALNPLNDKRCVEYFASHYAKRIPADSLAAKAKKQMADGVEPIWVCWLQGMENAPAIVRNCISSVVQHKKQAQQVFIITEDNYQEYIDIPSFIVSKRKKGIIQSAQFSDLIRVFLLDAYGGYWIDATCLMTDTFPTVIDNADLFMFHSHGEFEYTIIQSCFIHASKENYVIHRWKQLMTELWHNEDRLLHYFQLHLMFKAMIMVDERARREYERMPYLVEADMHRAFNLMRDNVPMDKKLLEDMRRKSFVHKVTYKLKPMEDSDTTFRDYFWQPLYSNNFDTIEN